MKGQVFSNYTGNVDIKISTKRFSKQFNLAQFALDEQIKIDTDPYVPFESGFLSGSVNQLSSGNGEIEYQGPYARYQYYGKVMIGSAPKEVTDIDLNYSKAAHPQATSFWFEESKAVNKQAWINLVRKIGGGG